MSAGGQPTSPDIVVITADDMGFSDLGCYGGEIVPPLLPTATKDGVP